MMKRLEELLAQMGLKHSRGKRNYELDESRLQALVTLAKKEKKSDDQMFTDLFDTAVNQRLTNDDWNDRWESLSPREQDVTALTCRGYTNRQMAALLRVKQKPWLCEPWFVKS